MFRGRLLFGVLFFLVMHRHVPAATGQPLPTVPAGRQTDADQEAGLPLIHNYHPRTYASASAAADNWTVLQDATGRIFAGNSAMAVVEAHLGDAEFGAEQFGREVGLSRMQLHRKLTALTGQSTGDFLRTMRLKRAGQLLEARAGTVSEVAFTVGYGSLSYFTRSFREQFGINPSEYAAKAAGPK